MNAIILAAGKSYRMFQTGGNIHKALLPIQNIPNIERTILILHCFGINEIIIAVPYNTHIFDYLGEKYSCKIVHSHPNCANTLYTLKPLIKYINDTFIIEGDVVLTKNIFCLFEHSTYYVIRYPHPETDAWYPILNPNGTISSFQIGDANKPAIFGISFWAHEDCPQLTSHLSEKISMYNLNDPNIFWDDNIIEILGKISVKTYEIPSYAACEMNTYTEYKYAQELCKNIILENLFFNDIALYKGGQFSYKINSSKNKDKNIYWVKQLLLFYGENVVNTLTYEELFAREEMSYTIENEQKQEIAFFSLVYSKHYILLRRLYIIPNYRRQHIGKSIIEYIYLFSMFTSKELRVNVYDKSAEKFYKSLGFKKLFKTFCLKP